MTNNVLHELKVERATIREQIRKAECEEKLGRLRGLYRRLQHLDIRIERLEKGMESSTCPKCGLNHFPHCPPTAPPR